jgi:hypothetical protein
VRLIQGFEDLRRRRGPGVAGFTTTVRRLIVVASSSRGGSSMLTELLRRSDQLIHLRAEINPFLRLVGLAYPDSDTGCDQLDAGHLVGLTPRLREVLDQELSLDAGTPSDTVDDERYPLDLAWRLLVQWPDCEFDPGWLIDVCQGTVAKVRAERGWPAGRLPDVRVVQLAVLARLRAAGFPVDPWCYDLPSELVRSASATDPPTAPPGRLLIEEPPFVLTEGWRPATRDDLLSKPLVIKTPSNAYRMGFLRALFPNASIGVLHLTRNPAAAINGLLDGWLHHGFHAHRMPQPLRIPGYGDRRPGDRWWWKFDLPPGWTGYTEAPLARVCAFQWRSAHRAILSDRRERNDYHRIRFEALTGRVDRRSAALTDLADWLGITVAGAFGQAVRDGVAPVAATVPPMPGRWLARADLIRSQLDQDTLSVAKELGYDAQQYWT